MKLTDEVDKLGRHESLVLTRTRHGTYVAEIASDLTIIRKLAECGTLIEAIKEVMDKHEQG